MGVPASLSDIILDNFLLELLFPQFPYARKITKELWYLLPWDIFLKNVAIKVYLQKGLLSFQHVDN